MNRPSAGRGGRGRGGRSSGGRRLGGRSSGGRGAQPVHSTEGHGLVRSPRAMGTAARLAEGRGAGGAGGPGGMGALLAQLLGGPLFGGDPDESDSEYGESDSEGYGYGGYGYSEEEDEELPRGCWPGGAGCWMQYALQLCCCCGCWPERLVRSRCVGSRCIALCAVKNECYIET